MRTEVTLGLCSYTHDSSAALIVDGELIGFSEEERLAGEKHTKRFPSKSVEWLLASAGLQTSDITTVAYNFSGPRYLLALVGTPGQVLNRATKQRAIPRAASYLRVYRNYVRRMKAIECMYPRARRVSCLHHATHGMYAFASSGYDNAAVLVIDSLGELQTTTISQAALRDDVPEFRMIEHVDDPVSLGYAYGAVTEHLGWRRGDEEGTVMALAAHGDPSRFAKLFERAIPIAGETFGLDPSLFALRVISSRYPRVTDDFVRATCPPRNANSGFEQVHADLAAALQARTEQVVLHLAARARKLTGSGLLCVSGGVAANCVAVGKIVEAGIFDEVHVPPAPGDAGTAIGAAVIAEVTRTRRVPGGIVDRCYLGPQFPDVKFSTHPMPSVSAKRIPHPSRTLAEQLAEGRIVGVFRGRLEAGPRALGNRSILASPLKSDVVDRLNRTVKFREPFRPFAPMVLADRAQEYFTLPQAAPFMSIASGVTTRARAEIPSIVHVNGTARVQTVTPSQNGFIADVLDQFAKMTGTPVLINTSLNVKGKPICGTPEMAIECLAESGLDALLIEDWWIEKL
jgi:carbamoyltransferase